MSRLALSNDDIRANIAIMRPVTFAANGLRKHFEHNLIATLGELMSALGAPSSRTVFRKLGILEYLTSYSHRGQYYTLQSVANFDAEGLWSWKTVWFSRFGNLLDTAEAFVERSTAGYTAAELGDVLHVKCKHALVALVRRKRLVREQVEQVYVYFSADHTKLASQRRTRCHHRASMSLLVSNPDLALEEAKAAVVLFLGTLDERQRRLYAGLESLKIGHGGDEHIAELFSLDRHTVARGRQELLSDAQLAEGVRRPGAGRPTAEKKRLRSGTCSPS